MKRKLIVTGAQGFVAGSVLAQAGPEWELHALSRSPITPQPSGVNWHVGDPMSRGSVSEIIRSIRPAAVIHTAAAADIDFCQANPDIARAVNIDFTRELADICAWTGARLVFCSTDTVFDGEHAPYAEEASPAPVNVYGETKAAAEKAVMALGELGAVARLSLVVGLPMVRAGNSLLVRLLAAFKAGRSVAVPDREVRTPVDVVTVGRALLELATGRQTGIFHLAGLNSMTRVELARTAAARFGFSPTLVNAQPPEAMAGRATRPRDVSMTTDRTRAQLRTPLLALDEGLALILEGRENP
jgi:dTDP-4-dehydrorhamnose reductase